MNASFLLQGLAQRVAFFYAPKILGGRDSRRAVAGEGARTLAESLSLTDLEWRQLGARLAAERSGQAPLIRVSDLGVRT